MNDWLRFEPEGDILKIHILIGPLIDIHPDGLDETDAFCRELYPVLDRIRDLCVEKNLKQVAVADFNGIQVHKIKPIPLIRLLWNCHEYTKEQKLLKGIDVGGADPVVKALIDSVRGILPPFMRGFGI